MYFANANESWRLRWPVLATSFAIERNELTQHGRRACGALHFNWVLWVALFESAQGVGY